MPAVIDLVEPDLLQQVPPRRLPAFFLPNLIGEHMIERPRQTYLDPLLLACLLLAMGLMLLRSGGWFWLVLAAIFLLRLATVGWDLFRRVYADYALLRHGLVLQAHVLRARTCRDTAGEIVGAYLDCVIPVNKRRTLVGSVWIPDAVTAITMERRGRLQVIALPRTPGTWRLIEHAEPGIRYVPAEGEGR